MYQGHIYQKNAEVAILKQEKGCFRVKNIAKYKKCYYIMIKGVNSSENRGNLNVYTTNNSLKYMKLRIWKSTIILENFNIHSQSQKT